MEYAVVEEKFNCNNENSNGNNEFTTIEDKQNIDNELKLG